MITLNISHVLTMGHCFCSQSSPDNLNQNYDIYLSIHLPIIIQLCIYHLSIEKNIYFNELALEIVEAW